MKEETKYMIKFDTPGGSRYYSKTSNRIVTNDYGRRVFNYSKKYPKASLKEARGHPEELIYRRTLAINYQVHSDRKGEYHSYKVQAWSRRKEDLPDIEDMEKELIRDLEKHLGYSKGMWWFPAEMGVEETAEIPRGKVDRDLLGETRSGDEVTTLSKDQQTRLSDYLKEEFWEIS